MLSPRDVLFILRLHALRSPRLLATVNLYARRYTVGFLCYTTSFAFRLTLSGTGEARLGVLFKSGVAATVASRFNSHGRTHLYVYGCCNTQYETVYFGYSLRK